jgi:hypothetical protein
MKTFNYMNALISVILDCFTILYFAIFQDAFSFGRRPSFIVKFPSSSWTCPKISLKKPDEQKPEKTKFLGLG